MKNILFYEPAKPVGHNGIGGSLVSLLQIVQTLDKDMFYPVIVLRYDFDIIEQYLRHGSEVIILSSQTSAFERETFADKHLSFLKRMIPAKSLAKEAFRLVKNKNLIQEIRRIISKYRIALVHCNGRVDLSAEAILASRLEGIPCICHNRSYSDKGSIIFRYLAKQVDIHVSISNSISENLINKGIRKDKIELFHNWINTKYNETFKRPEKSSKKNSKFQILSVGRIVPWKGQNILIDAAHELKNMGFLFRINIYGDTSEDPDYFNLLCRKVRDLKLDSCVFFCGYKKYEEIYNKNYHVAIHTSVCPEPFGRVIIEAMYNGIPVIASSLGGVKDIIVDEQNGFLYNPVEPNELVQKIVYVIKNESRRIEIGKAGHLSVIQHFNEENKQVKLTELYLRALS